MPEPSFPHIGFFGSWSYCILGSFLVECKQTQHTVNVGFRIFNPIYKIPRIKFDDRPSGCFPTLGRREKLCNCKYLLKTYYILLIYINLHFVRSLSLNM
ncbi:MAG: hypothetical protein IGS49_11490 [Chlorogloeopsis fritschii C42_A2020_084]|uniref:hypothetical protein n=1 Tax=Chlorogloeopsis fritschii TaxID=1124 RepID=UPI0019F7D5C9|nr:hypothetical protein [Chlorogloeopsis fritschii]MBF2006059.1 hypothetical protein [Chlorogloeopsis fritschii C42_A2020_084]